MDNKKKKIHKKLWGSALGILMLLWIWLSQLLTTVPLPQAGQPPVLYSNQTRQDLRQIFVSAIQSAQESVLLVIYGLSDEAVLQALQEKAREGKTVRVICDPKGSKHAKAQCNISYRSGRGLMHRKILVIDKKQVWIGSANMTARSLKVHGNLVCGMHHPEIARLMWEKVDKPKTIGQKRFTVGGQNVELRFLPKDPNALDRLTKMIDTAKKTVKVAMFTWTHPQLTQAIVDAKKRGVQTQVVIDRNSGRGTSAKTVKKLLKEKVPVLLSHRQGLLHHKFVLIDDETLIHGSANWTKAAFTRNDDCFMIMHDLTPDQRKILRQLWHVIAAESRSPCFAR